MTPKVFTSSEENPFPISFNKVIPFFRFSMGRGPPKTAKKVPYILALIQVGHIPSDNCLKPSSGALGGAYFPTLATSTQ